MNRREGVHVSRVATPFSLSGVLGWNKSLPSYRERTKDASKRLLEIRKVSDLIFDLSLHLKLTVWYIRGVDS